MKKTYLSLARLAALSAFAVLSAENCSDSTTTTANGSTTLTNDQMKTIVDKVVADPRVKGTPGAPGASMDSAAIAKAIEDPNSEIGKKVKAAATGMTAAQIKAELEKPAGQPSELRDAVKDIVTANVPAAQFTATEKSELDKLAATGVADKLVVIDPVEIALGGCFVSLPVGSAIGGSFQKSVVNAINTLCTTLAEKLALAEKVAGAGFTVVNTSGDSFTTANLGTQHKAWSIDGGTTAGTASFATEKGKYLLFGKTTPILYLHTGADAANNANATDRKSVV